MRDPFLLELDTPSASAHFTGGALELEVAVTFGSVTNNTTTIFAIAHKILKEHDNNNIRKAL